jgi:hypothetical protein
VQIAGDGGEFQFGPGGAQRLRGPVQRGTGAGGQVQPFAQRLGGGQGAAAGQGDRFGGVREQLAPVDPVAFGLG